MILYLRTKSWSLLIAPFEFSSFTVIEIDFTARLSSWWIMWCNKWIFKQSVSKMVSTTHNVLLTCMYVRWSKLIKSQSLLTHLVIPQKNSLELIWHRHDPPHLYSTSLKKKKKKWWQKILYPIMEPTWWWERSSWISFTFTL